MVSSIFLCWVFHLARYPIFTSPSGEISVLQRNHLPPKMEEFNSLEFLSNDDDLRNLTTDCLLQTGDFYIVPSPDSATVDIAVQDYLQRKFPYSPRGPPDRDNNPGKYNFVVEVNSKDVHKKRFLFSHRLCRIYVDINCDFSIQFNWDHVQAPDMFVRATVVFSNESEAQKRVEKCVQHFLESDEAGQMKHIAKNVLHSSRELNAQGVYYCGDPDVTDSWYSVLVRFHRDSAAPCSHAFKFTCKNSCSTGINRRPISIIFTLEDKSGYVHGRQTIGTRVCACPRRDMHKDEEFEGVYKSDKKRVPSNQIDPPPKPPKQIKLEKSDKTLTLPPLPVVDLRTMEAGLKVMYAMMKQGLDHRQQNPQAVKKYTECLEAFSLVLDDLKETEASPPQ